jgi:excinuclease ABC subunit C
VQGHHPVAGMVCFINGMPAKDRYRKFKIKTVVGINDFASMKEVVHRRYRALLEEDGSFPQLVIIDGGKGQLNAALESIEALGLKGKMTVVGLAKNKEEIFFPNDQESLLLPWDSESLKLIRRIRDEVHRFAITFHRQLRSKNAINNTLMNIEGIGPKTAELLLKTFRSVQNIAETDEATLAAVVGNAKAKLIKQALQHPEK